MVLIDVENVEVLKFLVDNFCWIVGDVKGLGVVVFCWFVDVFEKFVNGDVVMWNIV